VSKVTDSNGKTGYVERKLEMVDCGLENFNHTDKEDMKVKEVNTQYSCLKNKSEMGVGGTFRSKKFEYIQILLNTCNNKTSGGIVCKS